MPILKFVTMEPLAPRNLEKNKKTLPDEKHKLFETREKEPYIMK